MMTTGSSMILSPNFFRALVGGDAGTGQRRRFRRIQAADVDTVFGARNEDVLCVTSRLEDADRERLVGTEILLVAQAGRALPASQPRIDQAVRALVQSGHIRARADDFTGDFMAHGQRQGYAAVGQGHLLSAAEIVPAFPQMDIAVTHAGAGHADQHLVVLRFGHLVGHEFQRRIVFRDAVTLVQH